jgi:hypothetical protein
MAAVVLLNAVEKAQPDVLSRWTAGVLQDRLKGAMTTAGAEAAPAVVMADIRAG